MGFLIDADALFKLFTIIFFFIADFVGSLDYELGPAQLRLANFAFPPFQFSVQSSFQFSAPTLFVFVCISKSKETTLHSPPNFSVKKSSILNFL